MGNGRLSVADVFEVGKYIAMLTVVVLTGLWWFGIVGGGGGLAGAVGIDVGSGGSGIGDPLNAGGFDTHDDAPVATGRESGIDLERAEAIVLNQLRADGLIPETERTSRMDGFAAYSLRYYIDEGRWYDNTTQMRAANHYNTACTPGVAMSAFGGGSGRAIDRVRSARELAGVLGQYYRTDPPNRDALGRVNGPVGIVVGVTDTGDVYAVLSYC